MIALIAACKNEPDNPPLPVAPKYVEVKVTFPPFGTNPTIIDLNPIYKKLDGNDYTGNDIRFEIKDDRGNDNSMFPDGTIARNKSTELYGGTLWPWMSPPLFTQTFYDNDNNPLGEYSFFVGDRFNVGHFPDEYIREDTNGNKTFDAPDQVISSLPPPNASPLILKLR